MGLSFNVCMSGSFCLITVFMIHKNSRYEIVQIPCDVLYFIIKGLEFDKLVFFISEQKKKPTLFLDISIEV